MTLRHEEQLGDEIERLQDALKDICKLMEYYDMRDDHHSMGAYLEARGHFFTAVKIARKALKEEA